MNFNYITADTHFGHTHINIYEPSRMGKVQMEGYASFDKYMIDTWNETVKVDDNVLHLGDFAFKDGYKEAKKLKGKITLIKGNHDKYSHLEFYQNLGWNIIDNIFIDLPEQESICRELNELLTQEQLSQKLLACLVCEVNEKRVMFSHFPVFDDNEYDEKYNSTTSILEEVYLLSDCEINIHGHTHSAGAKEKFCKSVCLELNDFKLLKLSEIVKH